MYIYPDHLKAKATMWLWQLKDLTIVGVGVFCPGHYPDGDRHPGDPDCCVWVSDDPL